MKMSVAGESSARWAKRDGSVYFQSIGVNLTDRERAGRGRQQAIAKGHAEG